YLETEADGVLHPPFAVGGSRADLHAAHAQPDGRTRLLVQVLSDGVQVFFLYSHHGDTLGGGNLQGLHLVLIRDVTDLPQGGGAHQPTGDVRGNSVGFLVALENSAFFQDVFLHSLFLSSYRT